MAGKFRPLLAATYEEGVKIPFPVVASPKIDGIRCFTPAKPFGVHDTSSRTLKFIPNTYIRYWTRDHHFLDGELVCGDPLDKDTWDRTKSEVMTKEGNPAFCLYAFDETFNLDLPFVDRYRRLQARAVDLPHYIRVLEQVIIRDMASLIAYEEHCVAMGWEGCMYRHPNGRYKTGRSTINESFLVKWKRFDRQYAKIVGFVELEKNNNTATLDERGYTKRSSHKAGKVGQDTLGAFICENPKWEKTFKIGTGEGLTADLRKQIWNEREKYLGGSLIFEYQIAGSKDAPRIPSFKGFP